MARSTITLLPIMLLISCAVTSEESHIEHVNELRFTKEQLRTALEPPESPTKVRIGVKLIEIFSIGKAAEENPEIKAQFKLNIQWRDKRLTQAASDPHKVHAFQEEDAAAKLNTMFDPKVEIVDGTTQTEHMHLYIYPNGTATISQVVNVTVRANMNLQHFPFDNQTFNFRFASRYWGEKDIDMTLNQIETGLSQNSAPESWDIDYSSHYIAKSKVRAHSEEFQVFNFFVHAQRDPRYFLWRLLIPLIVIVVLSWNVFWMYEDASSALGNCFVFLLTVVAFHQIANGMLPLIPFFTFMDAIVFISYGFIIIPTFQVMVTSKLEHQGHSEMAETVRSYCRWCVPIIFVLTMLATTLAYFVQT